VKTMCVRRWGLWGEEKEGHDDNNSQCCSDEDFSDDGLGWRVSGVIGRDWLWSFSFPLRSSSLQRRFRVLFTGGGALGEAAWAGGGDDAGQSRPGSGVLAKGSRGSVWALVARVAGLPQNL
jgi:hypothetical protein